jgi:hypothetical protein
MMRIIQDTSNLESREIFALVIIEHPKIMPCLADFVKCMEIVEQLPQKYG